jgi:DNA-binding transcriptional ArsR family regulator
MASDSFEASVLKALGHPVRMRLLTFVAQRGEASPVEMSRALDIPLATVSHHTRVLRDLKYIELSRTVQRRGAVEHYYRALEAPFLDDDDWEMLPIPARRRVSMQLFRQVFEEAAAAGRAGAFDAAGAHIARRTLDLDAQGWRDLSRAVSTLLRRVEAIQARSDTRRDGEPIEDETARPSELAILHFGVAESAGAHGVKRKRRGRASRLP